MLFKCCIQYARKFGKLSNGHRTGKGQFSFQSQRNAIPIPISIPKKGNATERSNYCTTVFISPASKVMLKILQARPQEQYVNHELPDVQAGFRRGRGSRDQIANISWIIRKVLMRELFCKRVPEKHLLLLYWLCQSLWLCRSQQTVENSETDRNTRPPDLPPEKSICRSRSNH